MVHHEASIDFSAGCGLVTPPGYALSVVSHASEGVVMGSGSMSRARVERK